MSLDSYKMEVQSCCSETIPLYLLSSVESIAKKEGFVLHSVESKKVSTNGGNYLADLYLIDIKGQTNKGDKEVNLFVKNIIPTEGLSSFLDTSEAYANESFVYKHFARIFKELENEANVPSDERYNIIKGFDESNSEAIIMENLTKKGFKTFDRKDIPPLKFMELSIQQLAKLHGLGFAIQKLRPQFFKEVLEKMNHILQFNEDFTNFCNKMANVSVFNVREELKARLERFNITAPNKYEKYLKDKSTVRTLCHGDFRVLNIMMKEEEGEVTEIIPIDLQAFYYGCPVNDILYFIAGCTDRQFRKGHFDYLINLYYESLNKYLKYFDIDVADVYPRKEFDAAIRNRADFGLIIGIVFFPLILADEDDFPDINDVEISNKLDSYVVNRIEEMMEDLIDIGIL